MGLKQSGQGFACSHRLSMMSLFHEAPRIEDMFHPQAQVVLYLGDVNDLLPTIPDETVKLIVTSPPYNIGKEYETKLEIEKYLDQQTKTIKELYRVLREDGSICWQVGNYVEHGEVFPLDIFYYQIFKSLGMRLRNRIIWHFGHGLHASKRFSGRYETILWFTKSDRYTSTWMLCEYRRSTLGSVTTKAPIVGSLRAILWGKIHQMYGRL
jgi:adenine-specific DNA-methyltransferase